MKIIISPAKKMNSNREDLEYEGTPAFLEDTQRLLAYIQTLTYSQCKDVWKCNDKITQLNYDCYQHMNLREDLTPAILSYEGIQYQYMAPRVMDQSSLDYIQENLRILSGFYGLLKPLDGVVPYRLEMQARLPKKEYYSLYQFWGERLGKAIMEEDALLLNLASKEYSKAVFSYPEAKNACVNCVFGQLQGDRVIEKGTLAKMARGEMVRYLAENKVEDRAGIEQFTGLNYKYSSDYSNEKTIVFLKEEGEQDEISKSTACIKRRQKSKDEK